ncbi:transglycosylase SLT domain-containing protein [Sinimarinibacterium flocculans]|uniref:Transglycosylase-like protein with SLT domain n=1 Tax=Sinimarinibacterium flocculans TaxID=985250 RepID=A0A318E7K2_9GAMM|nr:transglycosylase SLT domain-containing protein [Sinimarinibacterium flocculans]PXV67667.1 transglycosylase-like protein with SLT domain [Sinimarinibacterium flocculans]
MAALVSVRRAAASGLLCLAAWAIPARALEIPPPAYQVAAHQAGIPPAVLFAVAQQESGVRLRGKTIPWPWTLNVAGEPRRFRTQDAACGNLQSTLSEVAPTRVDAGLAQINLGYQRHRYDHPCDVLDPYRNLAMAAEILREQHTPGEDWLLAIGRYHRPAGGTPAERYRRSVRQHLSRVHGNPIALVASGSHFP